MDNAPDANDVDQNAIQQYAFANLQEMLTDWLVALRGEIQRRREHKWGSKQEAREMGNTLRANNAAEDALEDALLDVQRRLLRVVFSFLEQHQQSEPDIEQMKAVFRELIIELHNPSTQEAILLGVSSDYRDLFRERFDEIGSLMWGMVEVIGDLDGDDKWVFLSTVAALNNSDLVEEVRRTEGLSISDIPDEYRR